MIASIAIWGTVILIAAPPPRVGAVQPMFEGIDSCYVLQSCAMDVSHDGSVVVGWVITPRGIEAVKWTEKDGAVGLGDLEGGDMYSEALAASANGKVIVGVSESYYGDQAFRWTPEKGMEVLPGNQLLHSCSTANDVSAAGDFVVGQAFVCSDEPEGGAAFIWHEDLGYEFLIAPDEPWLIPERANGVSQDGSIVVGQARIPNGTVAFRWTAGEGAQQIGPMAFLEPFGAATAVSANGTVIVGYARMENGIEAFRWTADEGVVGLGDLPDGDWFSQANAVCADGSVIVGTGTTIDGQAAFIWTPDRGMWFLQHVLEEEYGLDLTGWKLREALAVCSGGHTIAGWGEDPRGDLAMWVARIPQPRDR